MMFDESKLMSHFDGDKEMITELIEVFDDSYKESLTALKDSLKEEDFKKIELHAHTLKGMIANFFAEDLRVAAYDIEKMGHNSEISGYESQLAVLDEKLPMLITELRSFCG
ncbi:MAG: Hpt domain-containing protein [Bdellovibrionota bacterium]|nr:Hpt domain-containing protein [Bdellovibrionota bacterium]